MYMYEKRRLAFSLLFQFCVFSEKLCATNRQQFSWGSFYAEAKSLGEKKKIEYFDIC